ncbi:MULTISPECIES: hypothetical protein [Brevibacillus]|jgi:hypothetical protein|uniref:hypothetical protein n=1 Tax=Brevibacillus TaxID=55080 RepID=UPI001B8FA9BB|nr:MULTISPECIES: hypothetical protein [Brevibacillus]MBR8658349.1 hypothetical protein [Brevibacillus sp. NL20B1]MDT3414618.1 hypothetical protein [Brevibacillus aydinogluensis]
MELILNNGGIWKMGLAQKVFRPVILLILSVYIIGSTMLEGFVYFVIVDDVNQGVIPWDEFWGVSKLTVIRFLLMALAIFIIYRLKSKLLFILLLCITLFEFIVFLGANHFIFYPPLISNLLLSIICSVILIKYTELLFPKGELN